MKKITKLIFLLYTPVSLLGMQFDDGYFIMQQTNDYTIYGYFKGSGKLHRTFSYLSTNENGIPNGISEEQVKNDARCNADEPQNIYFLEELKKFKSELASCQNKDEYDKKCLAMYLIQQSKLLKPRLKKQKKPVPNNLMHLGPPNIYIIEHLNDIDEEKKSPSYLIVDQLSDHSFWFH